MKSLLLKDKTDFDSWLFDHETEEEMTAENEREPLVYPCIVCYHLTEIEDFGFPGAIDKYCDYTFVYLANFS